jgi:hypothetical protein
MKKRIQAYTHFTGTVRNRQRQRRAARNSVTRNFSVFFIAPFTGSPEV